MWGDPTRGLPGLGLRLVPLALLTFGIPLLSISTDLTRWRGDFGWGMAFQAQSLPVAMLASAFFAGWLCGDRRGGFNAWLIRAPESTGRLLGRALRDIARWPIAGLFLAAVVVAVLTWRADGRIELEYLWTLSTQVASVLLATLVGLLAARVLPQAAAALTATSLVALFLFLPWAHDLFETPGTGHPMPGFDPSPSYFGWTLLWVGMAAVALVVGASRRNLSRRDALTVTVCAVTSLVVGSLSVPSEMVEPSGRPPDRCIEGEVELCVYPGYAPLLDTAIGKFDRFFERAREVGLKTDLFPKVYWQDNGQPSPKRRGVLLFGPDAPGSSRFSGADLAFSVSTPLWCPAMFASEPPVALLADRQLVNDWSALLLNILGTEEFADRHPGLDTDLHRLVPEVESALHRLAQCRND